MLPPKTFGRPAAASRWLIRLDVVLLPLLPVTPMVRAAWSAIQSALPPVTVTPRARSSAIHGWVCGTPGERTTTSAATSAPNAWSPPASGASAASSPSHGTDRKLALSSTASSRDGPCGAIAVTAARPSRPVPQTATDLPRRSARRTASLPHVEPSVESH